MRSFFYQVDLEESKSILQQLKPQLQLKDLQQIFNQAIANFNTIAPRHHVELLEEQDNVQPDPIQEKKVESVQVPEKKPVVSTRIDITTKDLEVDAKIFDATSNKEIGHIQGFAIYIQEFGMCFHILSIGLKDANEIGKGYGSSALRQYLNYLQTSNDPHLQKVKYYHLVTHTLRPEPVGCFTKVGFEKVKPEDYALWKGITPYVADIAVMMVKKREVEKSPGS